MAKLNINRLSLALVIGLVFVAVANIAENVYSAIDPYLTGEEQEELRDQRYGDLGACPAPTPEELEMTLEEARTDYFDIQACVSDTSIAASIKSNNQMISEARSSGDVKKPYEKQEKPESSPCSKSDKKVMAEQARYGAKTEGLSEGKDGAETTASKPGSTAQYALISQNLQTCYELRLKEMCETGPAFKRYCNENPDLCADESASIGFRNFTSYQQNCVNESNKFINESRKIESRARLELATFEKYNYLSEAIEAMKAKDKEIDGKNQVEMAGVSGANSGEGVVKKLYQMGPTHNASSL